MMKPSSILEHAFSIIHMLCVSTVSSSFKALIFVLYFKRIGIIFLRPVLSGLVTPVGRVGKGFLSHFKKNTGEKGTHTILLVHDREVRWRKRRGARKEPAANTPPFLVGTSDRGEDPSLHQDGDGRSLRQSHREERYMTRS